MNRFPIILRRWQLSFSNYHCEQMDFNTFDEFRSVAINICHKTQIVISLFSRNVFPPAPKNLWHLPGGLIALGLSKTTRCPRVIFSHSLTQTWNQPLLQEAPVSFRGKRYFKASVWIAGGLVIISRLYQWAELENTLFLKYKYFMFIKM